MVGLITDPFSIGVLMWVINAIVHVLDIIESPIFNLITDW